VSQRWSLRKRITSWVVLSVGGLLAFWVCIAIWFMNDAMQRELDLLVVEELAELTVECINEEFDPVGFELVSRELELEHPGYRFAWRVWIDDSDEPWAAVGSTSVGPIPDRKTVPDDTTLTPRPGTRWRRNTIETSVLTDEGPSLHRLVVELLLDGTPRERELREEGALFLSLLLAASLLAILGGAVLAGRMARLLEQVAQSASAARLDELDEPHSLPNAPEEIRRVAEAFRSSVAEMRAEHSRNLLLTAGLAHELRSPMQNMITEAEVALLRERDNEGYKQVITRQLDEMQELAHVVDNLITLTALRDTRQLPRHEKFELGVEANLRLDKLRSIAEQREVNLVLRTKGNLHIDGDREALLLMLRNLIGNAIQWTPQGTSVRVELDGTGEDLVLTVEDEGEGIPEAERDRIFEPFYQGRPPSGGRMGYGLGLALAKAAVRSHGGEIMLDKGGSGGARFVVRLRRKG